MRKVGRRWRSALPVTLFFCFAMTLAMGIYTWRYEPDRYQAEYTFFALPYGGEEDRDALQLSRMLARDCDALLQTRDFQSAVLAATASDGFTRVRAAGRDGAHMIRVIAVGADPAIVTDLANGAGRELLRQAPDVFGVHGAREISPALPPNAPVGPNRPLKTLWALLASFGVFSLLGMLFGSDHRPLRWNPSFPETTQHPCFGGIADFRKTANRYERQKRRDCASLYAAVAPSVRESVRETVLALRAAAGRSAATITVAGMGKEGGSPGLALLLASELATEGFQVLLAEMDAYAPRLRNLLGVSGHMDLADCLRNPAAGKEAVRPTAIPGLYFIDACHGPGFVPALAATDAFAAFLSSASRTYRFIVLNAPPADSVSDAAMLSAAADLAVLAVENGRHTAREIDALTRRLSPAANGKAGFVLWGVPEKRWGRARPYSYTTKA